jgi:hypothetical protein
MARPSYLPNPVIWSNGWEGDLTAQYTRTKKFTTGQRKIPIFPIANEAEFLNIDIPTRVERINALPKDLDPFVTNLVGRKVSYFNEVFDTRWTVEDDKVKEKSYGASSFDTYAEYDIRDLILSRDFNLGVYTDDGSTVKPILLSVRKNKLYILTIETYKLKSSYVLKICSAAEPSSGFGYLESVTDFYIDIPILNDYLLGQASETLLSLSFSEKDPNIMSITTNLGRQLFYRLYFDYYYNDVVTNKVYTIESYPNAKIQVM